MIERSQQSIMDNQGKAETSTCADSIVLFKVYGISKVHFYQPGTHSAVAL